MEVRTFLRRLGVECSDVPARCFFTAVLFCRNPDDGVELSERDGNIVLTFKRPKNQVTDGVSNENESEDEQEKDDEHDSGSDKTKSSSDNSVSDARIEADSDADSDAQNDSDSGADSDSDGSIFDGGASDPDFDEDSLARDQWFDSGRCDVCNRKTRNGVADASMFQCMECYKTELEEYEPSIGSSDEERSVYNSDFDY